MQIINLTTESLLEHLPGLSELLCDAVNNGAPVRGNLGELDAILTHRRSLREGYGLPVRPQDCPATPEPVGQPPIACGEDLCGLQEQQKKLPSDWEDPHASTRGVC